MVEVKLIKKKASDENYIYSLKFKKGGLYLIDNKEINISYNQVLTFNQKPEIYYISIRNEIDFYDFNNNKISIDEYNKIKDDIFKNFDNEIKEWKTLEAQIEYLKLSKEYTPKYKEVKSKENVDIVDNVPFIIDTEDEYIVSDYFLNQNKPLYTFDRKKYAIDLFKKLCEENGLTEQDKKGKFYKIGTNSGLRFAKISQSYVFSQNYEFKNSFKGSFKQCLDMKNKLKDDITTKTLNHINMIKNTNIDKEDLFKKLTFLKTTILDLNVKVKSNVDHRSAINTIQDILDNL